MSSSPAYHRLLAVEEEQASSPRARAGPQIRGGGTVTELTVAEVLEDTYETLDGTFFFDFMTIFIMIFLGIALFTVQLFTNVLLLPSNWETDPQGAWTYFADVLLLPTLVTAVLFTTVTRLRETNVGVYPEARKTARENKVRWSRTSVSSYALAFCVITIVLESVIVLLQIIVWIPFDLIFAPPLCQLTVQCGDCGATPCAGTLAGGARWQFLVALLVRFFFVLVSGYYLFFLQFLSKLHSASLHLYS